MDELVPHPGIIWQAGELGRPSEVQFEVAGPQRGLHHGRPRGAREQLSHRLGDDETIRVAASPPGQLFQPYQRGPRPVRELDVLPELGPRVEEEIPALAHALNTTAVVDEKFQLGKGRQRRVWEGR